MGCIVGDGCLGQAPTGTRWGRTRRCDGGFRRFRAWGSGLDAAVPGSRAGVGAGASIYPALNSSSVCGGARGGTMGGGCAGRPTPCRKRRIEAGSVRAAITRMRPPQRSQVLTSMEKPRARRVAHVSLAMRVAACREKPREAKHRGPVRTPLAGSRSTRRSRWPARSADRFPHDSFTKAQAKPRTENPQNRSTQ